MMNVNREKTELFFFVAFFEKSQRHWKERLEETHLERAAVSFKTEIISWKIWIDDLYLYQQHIQEKNKP